MFSAINNNLNLLEPRALPYPDDDESDMFCYDEIPAPFVCSRWCIPFNRLMHEIIFLSSLDDIKRIFGYCLSRFRCVSKNGFGIWSSQFCLFLGRAITLPETAVDAAVASLVLHNMLWTKSRNSYTPPVTFDKEINSNTVIPGSWREDGRSKVSLDLPQSRQNNRYCRNVEQIQRQQSTSMDPDKLIGSGIF